MSFTTLVSVDILKDHLGDPQWVILDCRASLADPHSIYQNYLQSHIPGAVQVDLERDLSAMVVSGKTGRHPFPEPLQAAQMFYRKGVGDGKQVIAYDAAGGALAAGRAWWMLRWLGFQDVAVLDGGWQAWLRQGLPLRQGEETIPSGFFDVRLRPELVFSSAQIEKVRSDPAYRLVDARSAERFHGQNEQIDPIAGHIPGAINIPYKENTATEGIFFTKEELRLRYLSQLGIVPADRVVFYCGSGVTAVQNILAMMEAGLGEARLYPGSWSEWITDPQRPIATE
jgi:thiosulfate/3-mercaptopyruvate sulfurtransferase